LPQCDIKTSGGSESVIRQCTNTNPVRFAEKQGWTSK
jgi:hypothetical protein